MARIAGVDLPREKRVEIGLTYVFGIGRKTCLLYTSCRICFRELAYKGQIPGVRKASW